jgi:hypothetical protein
MAKTYPFTLDPFQNVSVACIVRSLPPEALARAARCTRRWAGGRMWQLDSGVRVLASVCGLASTRSSVSTAATCVCMAAATKRSHLRVHGCVCTAANVHGSIYAWPKHTLP